MEKIRDFLTGFFTQYQQGEIFPEKIPKLSFSTRIIFKGFPNRKNEGRFYTKGKTFPRPNEYGYSHKENPKIRDHLTVFAAFQLFYIL